MEIKENTFEGLEVLNDRLTKFNYNMESKMRKLNDRYRVNQTFYTHRDSKNLLTHEELLILLAEGFEDVSYGNDEYASFATPNNAFINGVHYDPISIYVCPNKDDDGVIHPQWASEDKYFYLYNERSGEEYVSEKLEHLVYEYKMIIKKRKEQ
tara:strand:- start:629 stop:1087 length:459 start_codon:yes stop_codon:yes gene_type:complete